MQDNIRKEHPNKEFTYSRIRRTPILDENEKHYHSYHEIYYFLSGHRKFFIYNKVYTVQKGDLLFIPANEIHRTSYIAQNDEHERIAISFVDSYVGKLLSFLPKKSKEDEIDTMLVSVPFEQRDFVEGIFKKMSDEYVLQDNYSQNLISQNVVELLVFMLRQKEMKEQSINMEAQDLLMIEAAEYIDRHYVEEITLESISARFHMSPSYFSRKFKSVTGFGFKEYVNALRLKDARRLLLQSKKSVTEISELCGYENSNYFGDVFKKMEGISPREYRKLVQ